MDPTGVGHPLGTADRIHVLSVLLSGTQPGRKDHLMPSYETLIQAQGQTESVCHWAIVLARCYYTRIAVSLPAVKTSPVIFLVKAPDNPHSDSKLPFYEKTQNGARICPDLSDPRHYSVDLFANIQQAIQTSNPWPAVVFVLSSCFCAVDTNLHDFFSVYLRPHTMNNLTLWVPGDKEQLESSSVKIKDADIQNLISDLIHKEGNQYMFDRSTAPKWIAVISKAMRMAKALLLSADRNHLTDLGVCFHSLAKYIQVIPLALWHLPSLNEHLCSLHQDVRNLNHNPGTGYRFPLDSGICKLDKSSSETSIFMDAINAITARVSSTMHLCQQQPASIPTKCIIVDSEAMRPGNITSLDANRAIDDWLDRLVEFHQRPFRATLPVIWATTSPHIDHPETCAEASLMARLFTDAAPKPILHSTFSSNPLDINLGTDHKSCPFCVLLAESIYERYCVRFHLPDRHYQFSPWVPPKGLPDDVMDTLERKLQAYLLNQHVDTLALYSSRRSAFIHKSLLENPKYMIAIKNDIAGISHGEMEDVSDPEADDEFAIVYEDFRD